MTPSPYKAWTCIGCLAQTTPAIWNETDGLCPECAEGEWPKTLSELPPQSPPKLPD